MFKKLFFVLVLMIYTLTACGPAVIVMPTPTPTRVEIKGKLGEISMEVTDIQSQLGKPINISISFTSYVGGGADLLLRCVYPDGTKLVMKPRVDHFNIPQTTKIGLCKGRFAMKFYDDKGGTELLEIPFTINVVSGTDN